MNENKNIIVQEAGGEIRRMARMALKGYWFKFFLGVLIYYVIILFGTLLLDLIPLGHIRLTLPGQGLVNASINPLGTVYQLLVSGPFIVGIANFTLVFLRNRKIDYKSIFSGFNIFGKSFLLALLKAVFCVAWFIAPILPGLFLSIIGAAFNSGGTLFFGTLLLIAGYITGAILLVRASLNYAMAEYIMVDNANMGASACIKHSKFLMQGNKGRLFGITIIMVLWILLAALPGELIIQLIVTSSISDFSLIANMDPVALATEIARAQTLPITILSYIVLIPVLIPNVYYLVSFGVFYEIAAGFLVRQVPRQVFDNWQQNNQNGGGNINGPINGPNGPYQSN